MDLLRHGFRLDDPAVRGVDRSNLVRGGSAFQDPHQNKTQRKSKPYAHNEDQKADDERQNDR